MFPFNKISTYGFTPACTCPCEWKALVAGSHETTKTLICRISATKSNSCTLKKYCGALSTCKYVAQATRAKLIGQSARTGAVSSNLSNATQNTLMCSSISALDCSAVSMEFSTSMTKRTLASSTKLVRKSSKQLLGSKSAAYLQSGPSLGKRASC